MPPSVSTVMQLRVDAELKQAFAAAAERERTTTAGALRTLMQDFVRESTRREAQRQSRLVASAPDADTTMSEVMTVQGFAGD